MTEASSSFVYVTYIRTTPEKLWAALTEVEFIKQYWFGIAFDTDWKVGSPWRMHYADGKITDEGEVAQCEPPRRLGLRWRHTMRPELASEGEAFCLIELEPRPDAVKLTVTHTMPRPDSKLIQAVSGGWPAILSNLKSLMEDGKIVLSRF